MNVVVQPLAPSFRDIGQMSAAYQAPLKQLDGFLARQISAFEPEVQPLVENTFTHKGKRLRPLLVLLSAGVLPGEQKTLPEPLIRACAIVELVHLATLVHDDILDNAALRHGARTLSDEFGAHQAVLLGDALFAHALRLAAEYPTTDVCRAVAEATRQVCSGEIAQTFARGKADVSIVNYRRFIDLKTAELFSVSAWLGAWIGYGNKDFAQAAAQYARHLGIAYQVYDDILDLRSDESKAGKTLGTDWATGKFTLPFLLLWQDLPDHEVSTMQTACLEGTLTLEQIDSYFVRRDVDRKVAAWFERELTLAQASLAQYGAYPASSVLPELLQFVRTALYRLLRLPS